MKMSTIEKLQAFNKETSNIVDYVEYEFAPFEEKPLTQVDSLVLSWFSYLRIPAEFEAAYGWEGLRMLELYRADIFDAMYETIWDVPSSARLLSAMAASPRFRNLKVKHYRSHTDKEAQEQFAAVTLQITPNVHYVAYRGTDSTFVGWKEDLNMAFMYPVPAQTRAAEYLSETAKHLDGTFFVGGHSKGGNLAVYSAMNSDDDVRSRLMKIFSHDGPGFPSSVFEDGTILKVADIIQKTVPQSSLVGMLLEHQENFTVVESTNFAATQHDPFSWVVQDGEFVEVQSRTTSSKYFDMTLNTWAQSLSMEDRETIIDALYSIADAVDVDTMYGLSQNWQKVVPELVKNATQLNADERDMILQALRELISLAGKQITRLDELNEEIR